MPTHKFIITVDPAQLDRIVDALEWADADIFYDAAEYGEAGTQKAIDDLRAAAFEIRAILERADPVEEGDD